MVVFSHLAFLAADPTILVTAASSPCDGSVESNSSVTVPTSWFRISGSRCCSFWRFSCMAEPTYLMAWNASSSKEAMISLGKNFTIQSSGWPKSSKFSLDAPDSGNGVVDVIYHPTLQDVNAGTDDLRLILGKPSVFFIDIKVYIELSSSSEDIGPQIA